MMLKSLQETAVMAKERGSGWCTWPAEALVPVDPLQAGGSMLAGVGGTFRDILLTVVAHEAGGLAVTLVAGGQRVAQ